MVGDLRMWLYRANPGNPRQMRRRRPLSTNNQTRSRRGYGSILSSSADPSCGSRHPRIDRANSHPVIARRGGSEMRGLRRLFSEEQGFALVIALGVVYATNIIDIGTTATVDGPLDGSTVILGQSSTSTFNGYTFVPVGMPGNPTIFALAQTPQITGG